MSSGIIPAGAALGFHFDTTAVTPGLRPWNTSFTGTWRLVRGVGGTYEHPWEGVILEAFRAKFGIDAEILVIGETSRLDSMECKRRLGNNVINDYNARRSF